MVNNSPESSNNNETSEPFLYQWDMSNVEFVGGKYLAGEDTSEEVNDGAPKNTIENKISAEQDLQTVSKVETPGIDRRWEAFTKGSKEAEDLKNDNSLLLFLTSADGGYAVKKTEAVETFIDKVNKAKDDKEFWDAQRLALTIQSDRTNFSGEQIQKVKDFMQTPVYQKKLLSFHIEASKKAIEKKTDDLRRCSAELENERKGGFFKRLLNRSKIKEAEMRVNIAKKSIDDAKKDLMEYTTKLDALNVAKDSTNNEELDTDALVESLINSGDEKAA